MFQLDSPLTKMDPTEELREKVRRAPRNNALYFIGLLKKCCNGKCDGTYGPSDKQTLEIFGLETFTTIKQIDGLANEYRRHDIRDVMENTTEQKVKEYLEDNLDECKIYDVLVLLIETWIKKNKKEFIDTELEKEICAADDDKWIQQDHVIELYSDGRITSQKGRDLYGWRSVFSVAAPLLHDFKMKLPRKTGGDDRTYAILESEELALAFRDRMITLSNNQVNK